MVPLAVALVIGLAAIAAGLAYSLTGGEEEPGFGAPHP